MIMKFDSIPGHNLAALLSFVHGDENQVAVPRQVVQVMIVRIKAINPDNQRGGTWYGLTLDILEWLPKGDEPGQNRVDSKYLLKVYEILEENRSAKCVSVDKLSKGKWPPISPGTKVRTTQPNMALRKEWTDEGWESKEWGVQGVVIAHHDSHGLCYDVRHEHGTQGCYDPSELEIVK